MKFFRKNLFPFMTVAFLAFVSVLAIEAAHHHDNLESHSDCSLCAWQMMGSSAPSTPTPPVLFHALFLTAFFTFTPFVFSSVVSFFTSGRAPPQNLL
jgi:hypothetical protein